MEIKDYLKELADKVAGKREPKREGKPVTGTVQLTNDVINSCHKCINDVLNCALIH